MPKPNTSRLDREIRLTTRKLEAVRKQEMWPLTGTERRAVLGALAGGSFRVVRGKSTTRAERKLESLWTSVQTRLSGEITALQNERQRIVTEAAAAKAAAAKAAAAKAAKKSFSWW